LGPQFFQQPDGRSGSRPHLVESGFLSVQFFHHHQRQDDPVFIKPDRGMRIGEEDAGIEDESPNHAD
jgi:hypothetical protein